MTTSHMDAQTRPIGWICAARKAYEVFPEAVRDRVNTALTIAAPKSEIDLVKTRLRRLKRELMK